MPLGAFRGDTQCADVTETVYRSVAQYRFVRVIMERREGGTFPLPAYLGSRFAYDLSQPDVSPHGFGSFAVTVPCASTPAAL